MATYLWQQRPLPHLQMFAETTASLLALAPEAALASQNLARFEGGNIGEIVKAQPNSYTLHLRSDNDDALPHYWRQWFYLRLSAVVPGVETTIRIVGGGQTQGYLPFYSVDQLNWIQFDEQAVQPAPPGELLLRAKWSQSEIWLARFPPYTYSHLQAYLRTLPASPELQIASLGRSPGGLSLPVVAIGDPRLAAKQPQIVLHARTHPGEVASSYVLEGLINFLLGPSPRAQLLRSRLQISIVPMLNVDGVYAGNNRVTPGGVNLEGKWLTLGGGGGSLDPLRVPREVQLLHAHITDLVRRGRQPSMALNLHASAGEPGDKAFVFAHFGPMAQGFTAAEAELYKHQVQFHSELQRSLGPGWLAPVSAGGRTFLGSAVPERWWWEQYGPRVMAMTLESTYGLAGGPRHWIQPDDLRAFGRALAVAIGRSYGLGQPCSPPRPGKALASCR